MLKIRDNADLKELEKFGFTKEPMIYVKIIEKGNEGFLKFQKYIYINEKSRTIFIQEGMLNVDKELETIYDLIQARISRKDRGVE